MFIEVRDRMQGRDVLINTDRIEWIKPENGGRTARIYLMSGAEIETDLPYVSLFVKLEKVIA